jgi:hypothetical protein
LLGSAIVHWTGRGRIGNLSSTIEEVLRIEGIDARVTVMGASVVVDMVDPVSVAMLFRDTPGISWIAAGDSSESLKSLAAIAERLAKAYLRGKKTFSVVAESTDQDITPSDVAGMLTSAILEAVSSVRTDDEKPEVRFRAAWKKDLGAVGVELCVGQGGTPMGGKTVVCLVSGGMHSSVVAWHALLSGYRVSLVHCLVDEDSLMAVASLYAELSHRVNPRGLSLKVWDGDGLIDQIRRSEWKTHPLSGFHSECGGIPETIERIVLAPLFLLTEEEYRASFAKLSVRDYEHKQNWNERETKKGRWRRYGGERSDIHGVLDGLSLPLLSEPSQLPRPRRTARHSSPAS